MKFYYDLPQNEGSAECIGIISDGEPSGFAGTTVYAMDSSHRNAEYERFAQEYDIHFIFSDASPTIDFYAVPRVDLAAMDSEGGFLASVGQTFDLSEPIPLIYISKTKDIYLITEDSREFLSLAPRWKENLRPYHGVQLFPSKEEAQKQFEIRDLPEQPTPKKMVDVVAALIWKENKFLICQRPAHKARGLLWEFVGGKVEPGETKAQALVRECREELAVTVAVGEKFLEVLHEYPDITVFLTLFCAEITDGTLQKLEHADLRWITPAEIPCYEFCPADQEILKKICEVYGS